MSMSRFPEPNTVHSDTGQSFVIGSVFFPIVVVAVVGSCCCCCCSCCFGGC